MTHLCWNTVYDFGNKLGFVLYRRVFEGRDDLCSNLSGLLVLLPLALVLEHLNILLR